MANVGYTYVLLSESLYCGDGCSFIFPFGRHLGKYIYPFPLLSAMFNLTCKGAANMLLSS
jgi:hypothetical protein